MKLKLFRRSSANNDRQQLHDMWLRVAVLCEQQVIALDLTIDAEVKKLTPGVEFPQLLDAAIAARVSLEHAARDYRHWAEWELTN